MDLIRELLLAAETVDSPAHELAVPGEWSREEINYHLALLIEANYLIGTVHTPLATGKPSAVVVTRMTWEGHDFLGAIRDKTVWERTKKKLTDAGAGLMPILIKEVATAMVRAAVARVAGI